MAYPFDLRQTMYVVYELGEDNKPLALKEYFIKRQAEEFSHKLLSTGKCAWVEQIIFYDDIPF